MENREKQLQSFGRLLDIMDTLREKCPWDHKQTFESLRPQTIEEVYELSDALLNNDMKNISKELGDVLLHVVFYAKLGSESGTFDIGDVIDRLCEKLIYRHPHIYGDTVAEDAGQVIKNWEQLKQAEKDGNKTILSGVPASLPPLIKAYRIQDKARAVGFDWQKKEDVWDKVKEEIAEFQEESASKNFSEQSAEAELVDVLFSIVNASRLYGLNPDNALEATCKKFKDRFTYLEVESKKDGKKLNEMTLAEMDAYWDEAKKKGL